MKCNLDDIIKSAKKILLLSHVNPDGDTLGSMCAMYSMIYNRFKIKADMSVVSNIPFNYSFLPNINLAQRYYDQSLVYDLVITLDVAAIDRVRDAKIFFDKAKCTVNIDHHKTNPGFGDYQIIEPDASSCGEVLFNYFKENNWEITKDAAECLYVAIMTDTGNFRFENTNSKVFRAVADLVEIGANPTVLYKKCYETKTKNLVMFQNYCVNKAEFLHDNKIAYTTVYKKDLEKFSAGDDYTDGIAETLRAIDTTEVAFVVKEVESKMTKVSMRSKKIDVAQICSVFGGGGHTFAAGCTIKASVKDSIEKLLREINL
ncbi:MAG: bifunctional oligoribonuclease/PAP phosphatase NrnA [Candidatus Gastranaerophilales bacterium]|nr:bifunctional oligoribonuclease/PAP phosphatase NrnA [Candidatus Gastranaerophilales bacterium]MCM1073042.1 bifunctional oligoribonuclease/PAP phosphatase NrnA [Bacteroides sp.]